MKYSNKLRTANIQLCGHLKAVAHKAENERLFVKNVLDNIDEEIRLYHAHKRVMERLESYQQKPETEVPSKYSIIGGALGSGEEIFRDWHFSWSPNTGGREKHEVFRVFLNVNTLKVRVSHTRESGYCMNNDAIYDLNKEILKAAKTLLYDVRELRPNVLNEVLNYKFKTNRTGITVFRGKVRSFYKDWWIGDILIVLANIDNELVQYGTYYVSAKGMTVWQLCNTDCFAGVCHASAFSAKAAYERRQKLQKMHERYAACLRSQHVYGASYRAEHKRCTFVMQVPTCYELEKHIRKCDQGLYFLYKAYGIFQKIFIRNFFHKNGRLFIVVTTSSREVVVNALRRLPNLNVPQKKEVRFVLTTKLTDLLIRSFRSFASACEAGTNEWISDSKVTDGAIVVYKHHRHASYDDAVIRFCKENSIPVHFAK